MLCAAVSRNIRLPHADGRRRRSLGTDYRRDSREPDPVRDHPVAGWGVLSTRPQCLRMKPRPPSSPISCGSRCASCPRRSPGDGAVRKCFTADREHLERTGTRSTSVTQAEALTLLQQLLDLRGRVEAVGGTGQRVGLCPNLELRQFCGKQPAGKVTTATRPNPSRAPVWPNTGDVIAHPPGSAPYVEESG